MDKGEGGIAPGPHGVSCCKKNLGH